MLLAPLWLCHLAAALTYRDILLHHNDSQSADRKQFPNAALAFVTPWNSVGYDMAKLYARKFSHVAPVWLQLAVGPECKVRGTHDVDHAWMEDVRAANPDVAIVPRLLVEYEEPESAVAFATQESVQNKCLRVVLEYVQRNQFDGLVFEFYVQTQQILKQIGRGKVDMLQLIINLAEQLTANGKQLIVVVPPCHAQPDRQPLFGPTDLRWIEPYVRFVLVMTYDYPANGELAVDGRPPVAPVPWVRRCMDSLLSSGDGGAKLLMGINFYGYLYDKKGSARAILGADYLQRLEADREQAGLHWDDTVKEHFTVLAGGAQLTNYPSLQAVQAKLRLAEELGVGVAVWEIGQGLRHFFDAF